jgi:hypothetical protein
LAEYKKKTGNDLLAHWLAAELQTCDSVDAVLDILRDQVKAASSIELKFEDSAAVWGGEDMVQED